jgi:hypothetical protein
LVPIKPEPPVTNIRVISGSAVFLVIDHLWNWSVRFMERCWPQ